jgi:type III restriction enzyme
LNLEATDEAQLAEQVRDFVAPETFGMLPSRFRKAVEHAVALFHFHENKATVSFAPVFQPLLGPIDHAAEALMLGRLSGDVPSETAAQKDFFAPDMARAKKAQLEFLRERARSLKRLLVHRSPLMPTGLLLFCLEYAAKDQEALPGVFASVRQRFYPLARTALVELLTKFYAFRNTYVAHAKAELTDPGKTREALCVWVETLAALHAAVT